jgi:uncharacterized protein YggU (UPF0235/DUF167 family)
MYHELRKRGTSVVENPPWAVTPGGLALTVRLTPKGGRDAIEGIERLADGSTVLKARVRAVASEGAANAALIRLVAATLGVAPSRVTLTGGAAARVKRLKVEGDAAVLAAKLAGIVK